MNSVSPSKWKHLLIIHNLQRNIHKRLPSFKLIFSRQIHRTGGIMNTSADPWLLQRGSQTYMHSDFSIQYRTSRCIEGGIWNFLKVCMCHLGGLLDGCSEMRSGNHQAPSFPSCIYLVIWNLPCVCPKYISKLLYNFDQCIFNNAGNVKATFLNDHAVCVLWKVA